ncbi:hypothetical protein BleG1_2153 [Shouchella lehensis G1]|uniref:DUF2269 family protein n=1 Tax=Shouchella lehensis G1 TaxID=1246626 RepID=A0A060LU24_9BACI|nr:hypothetical protein BleG1_2153 [Shouchella lehensis G1]
MEGEKNVSQIVLFATHMFTSIVLFLCIPLPFLYYAARLDDGERFKMRLIKVYRVILVIAHIGLLLLIATGIPLLVEWRSWWTWGVVLLTLVIGASLGITSKSLRLMASGEQEYEKPFRKASLLLAFSIGAMFLLKYSRYLM